jgi:hypothetical protein
MAATIVDVDLTAESVPTTGMSGVEKGKSRNFTSFALEETNSE